MKINVGELVINTYSQGEVLSMLADGLTEVTNGLASGMTSQNWGTIGAAGAQLANLANIAKALNESVNGQKEKTVL